MKIVRFAQFLVVRFVPASIALISGCSQSSSDNAGRYGVSKSELPETDISLHTVVDHKTGQVIVELYDAPNVDNPMITAIPDSPLGGVTIKEFHEDNGYRQSVMLGADRLSGVSLVDEDGDAVADYRVVWLTDKDAARVGYYDLNGDGLFDALLNTGKEELDIHYEGNWLSVEYDSSFVSNYDRRVVRSEHGSTDYYTFANEWSKE